MGMRGEGARCMYDRKSNARPKQQQHSLCRIIDDFHRTPGYVPPLNHKTFHHSDCVRVFADSGG
jgi:hypothetical protein